MEALIIIGVYCMIMGSIVLIGSGLICYFFPAIHILFILAGSALFGIVGGYLFNVNILFAVVFNVILSAVAAGLGRFGRYLKNKTDVEPESILHS
ncbi:hypothetical protein A8F94_03890 [Bacillus sp. FJAT-27225]|uniref:hypothetical protein n=1 Tax=Bacillus sp. FJAT-27225 TaxID=1743144 RepID=UPI00080C2AC5|nr:hypothetical protein [Bacillus sp. FJAT-27225]OCA91014.1 hypothetical protein A8F94_03890 [Bacillus sp. FJAT-27225]